MNNHDGSLADAARIPALTLPRNYEGKDTANNEGVYAQLLWGLSESTRQLLGARHDRSEQRTRFNDYADGTDNDDFTMCIGLTQDFGEHLTAYAVYAESFNPVIAHSREGTLDPESGTGYELGFKGEWFDGRFTASAAVFRQELDNRAIPDHSNLPNESFQISGGSQRTDGLELEATGEPLRGWTLQAAAAWLDAEYIDPMDYENYGKTPGGTVERQFSFFTEYEMQEGPLKGVAVGLTALSVGDRIVLADQNYAIEGYERFDLHVGYDGLPDWKLCCWSATSPMKPTSSGPTAPTCAGTSTGRRAP